MPGLPANHVHAEGFGHHGSRLVLDTVQQPYNHVILAFFHYYHTPALIQFKDMPANDPNSIFEHIRLTPRRRQVSANQTGRPEFGRFRRSRLERRQKGD
jgi:hypothetical protein